MTKDPQTFKDSQTFNHNQTLNDNQCADPLTSSEELAITAEHAESGKLSAYLQQLGGYLDSYLEFNQADAMVSAHQWRPALNRDLPNDGVGIEQVLSEFGDYVIPNGSQIPRPGCTSFITTGAASIGVLAGLAGSVAAPQRIGLHAFNLLEQVSLTWLADLCGLTPEMKGVYSSGGSVANLLALGAARQQAFERRGVDPAEQGVTQASRIYATQSSHRTIHRAAAVLGLGRNAVVAIEADPQGRMNPEALRQQLELDAQQNVVPIAIVATAGITSTGAIDPLLELSAIAQAHQIWFHVDGAYGLPGLLDPQVAPLYQGLEHADSVIVDPHKWLGAPVGIGATFVRDRGLLSRAFAQGEADYLEGSFNEDNVQNSMDSIGIPYQDFGVELSSPSRGAVVWSLIREIGKEGLRQRVCRHNAMARRVESRAQQEACLEVVQAATLSICCFRYVSDRAKDLNEFNRLVHRQLVRNGKNIPSTAMVNGVLAIRPCFIGARTGWELADSLVDEVMAIGKALDNQF